jgi:hypothetical protein
MAFWKKTGAALKSVFTFGGTGPIPGEPYWMQDLERLPFMSTGLPNQEQIESSFEGYVSAAYKSNGPIFSVMLARQMVFSEVTFIWRDKIKKGNTFGSGELALLENPWPGGTTGELLARMIQDADLAGNAYVTTADDDGNYGSSARGPTRRLVRLRPDWVTLIIGSSEASNKDPWAADAKVVGILYRANMFGAQGMGVQGRADDVLLLPNEVAHFSPIPDPVARFRGMSWLTPILNDIMSDTAATVHKKKFFEHAAVPNLAIKFDKDVSKDDFNDFVAKFKSKHQGAWNAYKTLFLLGGADVTPLTMDFRQLDFSQTVGKGESRIASAGGVPPTWVGFSEGLQGSGLNAGNFAAARRRFADGTIRPMWRMVSACLENLVTNPNSGAQLWYDAQDVAFLREDVTDLAEIMKIEMVALDFAIKAGFEPDAAIQAVKTRDLSFLSGHHTGLVSVQMQPPATALPPAPAGQGLGPTQTGNP